MSGRFPVAEKIAKSDGTSGGPTVDVDIDLYRRLQAIDLVNRDKPDEDQFIDTSPENLVEVALEEFLDRAEPALRADS